MKKRLLIVVLFMGLNTVAQSTFKKGYYITTDNKKTEGYFKTFGPKLPEKIIFRVNIDSELHEEINTEDLNELSFGHIKYKRKEVMFEVLDNNMAAKKGSNSKNFSFVKKLLFLNQDLESDKLNVYSVEYLNNVYIFYEVDSKIELLKYKVIKPSNKKTKISEYRKQLFQNFKLKSLKSAGKIGGVKYKLSQIIGYIKLYLQENNISYIEYENNKNLRDFKDVFDIRLKTGYSFVSQSLKPEASINYDSSNNPNALNLGFDIEMLSNTIFRKSSLVLSYTYYLNSNTEGTFSLSPSDNTVINNDYAVHEFGVKYKRYFKLKDHKYFFVNGGVVTTQIKGATKYIFTPQDIELTNVPYDEIFGFTLGLGYVFDKIQLDVNYTMNNQGSSSSESTVALAEINWLYNRNSLSFSIGYNLF